MSDVVVHDKESLPEQPARQDTDEQLAARLERWADARVRRDVDNKGTQLLREAAERLRDRHA